jgi:hypothetical protein
MLSEIKPFEHLAARREQIGDVPIHAGEYVDSRRVELGVATLMSHRDTSG